MKLLVTFTKGVQIMTVKEKRSIEKQQNELMQERDNYERMQTEHSDDAEFYRYCQNNMDRLDEEAERLRRVLEVGCCE